MNMEIMEIMEITTTKEEEVKEVEKEKVVVVEKQGEEREAHHPYAFHVSGPRNLVNLNWRDLINSSW